MLDRSIEETIEAGAYDLAEVLDLIDVARAEGRITALARDALAEHARANARAENSYGRPEERILALEGAVRALDARVAALEGAGGSEGGEGGTGGAEEWPEWRQPVGALDAYAKGARVTFDGKHWTSLIDANVWSPAVYPQGWEEA